MITSKTISTKDFFINASKKVHLSKERIHLIKLLGDSILAFAKNGNAINLNFICTHNSRRSQLCQTWGFFAADYFNLKINSFSGGTETTAFHRNTVKTLQASGFHFSVIEYSHQNPVYEVSFGNRKKSILGYSKIYDDAINLSPYFAITTCGHADENCPYIPDAVKRFHLPFVDPKFSDNLENSSEVYLKTNQEVAANIFFLFNYLSEKMN